MMRKDDTTRGRLGAGVDAGVEERLPLLMIVILLVFLAFIVRLFQLQIIMGEVFAEESDKNSVRLVRLEAPRGDILDREGRVIATTRPAFGLQIMPSDLRNPDLEFRALGQLLEEDLAALRAQVGDPRGRARFQPVRLAGDLSYDRLASVESHLYALPGVMTDVRPRRDYVAGQLASHLLGYLGEIQRQQLETRAYADYRSGDVVGQSGVEALEQPRLRGRDGGRNVVVDVRGRVVDVLDEEEPIAGGSVTLTIDLDLQQAAEDAFLPDAVGDPPKMGALVAMDVQNGDLLALVSKPSFDPNAFAGGVSAATWKSLTTDTWRPLQDRAIAGQYPPGSTYKAIVAAAALQEKVISTGGLVYCPGHFTLGRRTYRCWKKEGHGAMSLHDALVQSCDVYFYTAGLKLGIDRLAFFARGFNLGRRTGIPLPGEQSGLVPTAAWKQTRFGEPWGAGETVSASIGQGFNLITPLQLAVAYAAIANGGRVLRPRLTLTLQDPDGNLVPGPAPEVRSTVPVSEKNLALVREALTGVVQEPRGTGGRARVPGMRVAGKTGTAQVVHLKHTEDLEEDEVPLKYRDHAWFVAFAPAEAPQIVVAVLNEHGGHGGSAAAPIAQKVLARWALKHVPEAQLAEAELQQKAAQMAAARQHPPVAHPAETPPAAPVAEAQPDPPAAPAAEALPVDTEMPNVGD
jgi:penicillin-binding protein 2